MKDENGTTKVRFDLWCVLGFLCSVWVIGFGFLYDVLATGKRERLMTNMQVESRLVRLETNFSFVMDGIADLKRGQREVVQALDVHERNTLARKGDK